jgi:uncharacterized protein (TIGR02996 family)
MDLLAQHEAFLRAIFDAPDDDTPRLVYADFLDEHGLPGLDGSGVDHERGRFRAGLIRAQCALAAAERDPVPDRRRISELEAALGELTAQVGGWPVHHYDRGFPTLRAAIQVRPSTLLDTVNYRLWSVIGCPHWFGSTRLQITGDRITSGEVFDALLAIPALARVADLDLSGKPVEARNPAAYQVVLPVVTNSGVAALAHHRLGLRVAELDLRNNNLDNDAARALVMSPYLDNLRRLRLLEGNHIRGKVWQRVVERFGENVAG